MKAVDEIESKPRNRRLFHDSGGMQPARAMAQDDQKYAGSFSDVEEDYSLMLTDSRDSL
jgi:hypothetical protein